MRFDELLEHFNAVIVAEFVTGRDIFLSEDKDTPSVILGLAVGSRSASMIDVSRGVFPILPVDGPTIADLEQVHAPALVRFGRRNLLADILNDPRSLLNRLARKQPQSRV